MTSEVVKDAALERRKILFVAECLVVVVHVGLDEAHVAKSAFGDKLPYPFQGRIAAVHVADLERNILRAASLHNGAVRLHRLAARLVAVHGDSALGVDAGNLHQIAVGGLDEYDIYVGNFQRL